MPMAETSWAAVMLIYYMKRLFMLVEKYDFKVIVKIII